MTDYVTLEEFQSYLFPEGNAGYIENSQAEAAITAASRAVDSYCARRFYADAAVSARYYQATNASSLEVDDFSTTAGLLVAVDSDDNGTYELAWSASDFYATPLNREANGIGGQPYTGIVSTRAHSFPTCGNRTHRVSVTAKWGWAEVPVPVKQATYIKAARIYRRAQTPDGFAAGETFGAIRVSTKEDPDVVMLLGPYRAFGGAGLVVA